jgi:hypothetical protein
MNVQTYIPIVFQFYCRDKHLSKFVVLLSKKLPMKQEHTFSFKLMLMFVGPGVMPQQQIIGNTKYHNTFVCFFSNASQKETLQPNHNLI